MKLLTIPKHLSDAVAPLMTLNYLLGIRILEYSCGKIRTVPSLVYLLLLLGTFCASVNVKYKFYKEIPLLKLQYALYQLMVYVNAFVVMYDTVLGCFYTKVSANEYIKRTYTFITRKNSL